MPGQLNAAAVEALADPAVRSRLADLGFEIFSREQQTPEALAAMQRADAAKWWPIIKELGIKREYPAAASSAYRVIRDEMRRLRDLPVIPRNRKSSMASGASLRQAASPLADRKWPVGTSLMRFLVGGRPLTSPLISGLATRHVPTSPRSGREPSAASVGDTPSPAVTYLLV